MWLTSKDRTILKARRKNYSSNGKSSFFQRLPALFEEESVAVYNDQISSKKPVSSKDPAMANTVETPSAAMKTGIHSSDVQRSEARSTIRSPTPVWSDKAHATVDRSCYLQTGDSSREKGGTQKFLTVHSHCKK